jgi:hypothetical protein
MAKVELKFGKYMRPCPFDGIDVYRVLTIFEVTDPALQHAIKKLLCAGKRGGKNKATDIRETIVALERWEEMQREEFPLIVEEIRNEGGLPEFDRHGNPLCRTCKLPKDLHGAAPYSCGSKWGDAIFEQ